MRMRLAIVLMLIHGITLLACGDKNGGHDDTSTAINPNCVGPVAFADAALESKVRAMLDKPTGDIDATALTDIVALYLPRSQVGDLTGLTCFADLQTLILTGNHIVDILLLTRLTHLRHLDLSGNSLDCNDPATRQALQMLTDNGVQLLHDCPSL